MVQVVFRITDNHLTCRQPSPAPPSQRPTSRGRPITITQTVVGDSPVVTVTPSPSSTAPVLSPVFQLTTEICLIATDNAY